jgi:hypothetical protein
VVVSVEVDPPGQVVSEVGGDGALTGPVRRCSRPVLIVIGGSSALWCGSVFADVAC